MGNLVYLKQWMKMSKRYILSQWPESQHFMDNPRFSECIRVTDIDGHDEVGSSAYMVPEDLYEEVLG